jgi:hypothetical protein
MLWKGNYIKTRAGQPKINTKNVSTRRLCILRRGSIDSWHRCQEPKPLINGFNGVYKVHRTRIQVAKQQSQGIQKSKCLEIQWENKTNNNTAAVGLRESKKIKG